MTTERKCPSCGSYAIAGGWGGAAPSCRRCGYALAPAGQMGQYGVAEQRAAQWKRVSRWLWPGAVLLYAGVAGLFQQGPPWTLTNSLGDWLMLWLIFGLIGVPISYCLLLIVAGCAFNWIVAYTGAQRLLGVVGVLRGAALAGIGLWSRVATISFGPVGDALFFVGLLALMFGMLLLGPADSRRQMDMLAGLMVTLVTAVVVAMLGQPAYQGDCAPAQGQAGCPPAQVVDPASFR